MYFFHLPYGIRIKSGVLGAAAPRRVGSGKDRSKARTLERRAVHRPPIKEKLRHDISCVIIK